MEKRQTGVHWKVLWEVLGKLTKTLEKGNFAVEQEVYDITEDTKVAVALGTKWVLVKDTCGEWVSGREVWELEWVSGSTESGEFG